VSQMWPQNCMALRFTCNKISTVSSVQVANVVGMSDRQTGKAVEVNRLEGL